MTHDVIRGGFSFLGVPVRILMYADEIVQITDNRETLQAMINRLHVYYQTWDLIVNLQKSKIMIFNASDRKSIADKWYYDKKRYRNSQRIQILAYHCMEKVVSQ